MSDDNFFFKWIWRFNALAISAATVLCILVAGAFVVGMLWDTTRRNVVDVVNIGDQAEVKNDFFLGRPSAISATGFVRIPLYRDQAYDRSFYSKSSGANEVNFLFVDTGTGKNGWLVPTVDQLFLYSVELTRKLASGILATSETANGEIVGLAYAVIDTDTNGDGVLSERDAVAVARSASDGTGYVKKIEAIDRLFSLTQIADDKIMVLYEKGGVTQSDIYDLAMETPVQSTIPKLAAD